MSAVEKNIWGLFYFFIFVVVLRLSADMFGVKLEEQFFLFKLVFLAIPVLLLILHSFHTLSFYKSVLFISLAAITGTVMEYMGLTYGTVFGGYYVYKSQFTLFHVPLSVIAYWGVFIYIGYCLVNSFLYWVQKDKPNTRQTNAWLLPLLVLLDGVVVVAIDLFMDPLQVKMGSWQWLSEGPYFGIPIGNFIGWFMVTILVTGIFRVIEYFFPRNQRRYTNTIFLIPVLGYGAMSFSYALLAIKFQMYSLAFIGSCIMLPIFFSNIYLFAKYRLR